MLCQRCRTSLLCRLPFRQQGSTSLQASRCSTLVPYRQSLRHYSAPASDNPSSPQSSSTPSIALPSVAPPSLSAPVTLTRNEPPRVMSGTPAGTKLKGINYMKNKPEVFALEDHEYPDWLWGLLDEAKERSKADGSAHLSTMNKKQRLRHERKMAALAASQPRKIPLHEQAIDITPADAVPQAQSPEFLETAKSSIDTCSQITKSAREARRKSIKEANFLRGM
ncbi:ribosomal L37 superfamily domain-containing protein [Histoplasma capsulatum var. duboisii H88]|nr:ribosomal L37 superfamily domain-containing protein [Histoplasma capsulatum var. duboisii H88]